MVIGASPVSPAFFHTVLLVFIRVPGMVGEYTDHHRLHRSGGMEYPGQMVDMVWYGVYGADMGYMGQCTTAGLHRGCVYGAPSTGYMEHHSRDGEWANTVTLVVVDKEVDEEGEDKDEMVVMKESMWG